MLKRMGVTASIVSASVIVALTAALTGCDQARPVVQAPESTMAIPSAIVGEPASDGDVAPYLRAQVDAATTLLASQCGTLFRVSGRTDPPRRLNGPSTASWETTISLDVSSVEVPLFTQTEIGFLRFGADLKLEETPFPNGIGDVVLFSQLAQMPKERRVAFMTAMVKQLAPSPGQPLSSPSRPVSIYTALPYSETGDFLDTGIKSSIGAQIVGIGSSHGLSPEDLVYASVDFGVSTGDFLLLGWFKDQNEWRVLAARHGWEAPIEELR